MPDTLHDKVVLIVGGTEAGGASLVVSLAKRGADVAIVYFDDEHQRARQIQKKVESNGRRCLTVAAEPDSEWFTGRVIGRVVKDLGHLDIFIDYAALPQNDPGCGQRGSAAGQTGQSIFQF